MDAIARFLPRRYRGVYVAALVILVCAITVAFYFRYQILDGFTVLNGDRYDQVIAISIFEHWRNTFSGIAHWSETGYFYPVKDTLGYNDSYFLFGAIYSVFRGFGIDPFLGGELVNVAMRAIGFLGFYVMARRIFAFPVFWALLGAILFTISNNMFVESNHTQLFSVALVPVMAVLVAGLIAAVKRGDSRAILSWGIAAAALYGAWLVTAFYMAWYFAFFGTFLVLAYLCMYGREAVAATRTAIRAQSTSVRVVAAAFVLFAIPFFRVYVPKAVESGMHKFADELPHTLLPLDIVDVTNSNLLYGRMVDIAAKVLPSGSFGRDYEQLTGIPLVLLFLFACGAYWLWRNRTTPDAAQHELLRAVALATVVTWILALQIGGASLWWLVYHLFPGAQATQVVARYQIFLTVPVIIVALSYLSRNRSKIAAPVLCLVCAVLIVEEINVGAPWGLQREHEVQRLASVPRPPPACRAFFVSHERPEGLYPGADSIYSHNVDAMIIAETMHIPTPNGYATFVPRHWNLRDPEKPDYMSRVKAFVALHPIPGLCRLDLRSLTWSTKPFA
jgi:hypothetical protein